MPPFNKPSLADTLAQKLHDDLKTGVWKDTMPGLRTLAEYYSVSVRTCSEALFLLEEQGIVSMPVKGKPRSILLDAIEKPHSARRQNLLIIHTSRAPLSSVHSNMLNEIQTIWEASSGVSTKVKLDYKNIANADKRLTDIIHRYSADAAVLINAPAEVVDACLAHIPCFQIGGLYPGSPPNITIFGSHFQTEIQRYTRHLVSWGHTRILLPIYDEASRPLCMQGMLDAYGDVEAPADLEELIPCHYSSQPKDWMNFWKEKLSQLEPTALIILDDVRYLSLTGFCLKAGIKIPWDLSVILFHHNPQFEWANPRPTMGLFPGDKVVDAFKKWIKSNYKPMGRHTLPLTHQWGESVSRVRQQRTK